MWYDPFGEIISHTLPLTLTDRLFASARRDGTIGLYQVGAGWYDPYTAQGIYAGGEVFGAPAGLNVGVGEHLGAPGVSAQGAWGTLGGEAVSELAGAGLSKLAESALPGIYQAEKRSLLQEAIHLTDIYNIRRTAATRFFKRAEYWAQFGGKARWLCSPFANPLQQYNAWRYDHLAARADWQWRVGLDRLDRKFGRLEWLNKYGDDALDLGIGTTLDIFEQGWNDLPMALSRDLTWGQYGMRVTIQTGGSLFLGFWGIKLSKSIVKALALSNPAAFAVDVVIGVTFSYVWEDMIEPRIYEIAPELYPKSQRVGPAESLPW